MKVVRAGLAAAATSALFVGAMTAPAEAASQQDGLVNVNVDNVLNDNNVEVNAAVLATVVAQLCDVADVGPIAAGVLGKARATDNSGQSKTICTTSTGAPVTLVQN